MGYKRPTRVRPVIIEGKKSEVRFKERVDNLVSSGVMSATEAEETVTRVIQDREGYKKGELVQYHAEGLRAGYLVEPPQDGVALVLPIVPRGKKAESAVKVRLADLVTVGGTPKFAPEDIMAEVESVAKKSAKKNKKAAGKTAAPKKAASSKGTGKRLSFPPEAKIAANYDEKKLPYREGSARATLLLLAANAGTVEKFLKKAGEPSGGSPTAYLALFVKAGHLKVTAPAATAA